jgi:CRP/FNR family transcriptional regulator, cyclic AMP receptor protein
MMNSGGIQPVMKSKGFGEMAVMDLRPRSASVQAIENCAAICLSAANLYRVYARI